VRLATALQLTPHDAERFYDVVEPVRRHSSPPRTPAALEERGRGLPVALTSFVGRENELDTIPKRLRAARLVTLTGVGGSGKTRLAIEVARRVSDRYRDGARLVELAQLTDPGLVAHRVAAAIGVQAKPDRPLDLALADALSASERLLVLDNCEHVLDACAVLVDLLLRECPALRVLATSREPIGIPGEVIRKSLVVRIDAHHGTARYGLLETLRQYARGKLADRDGDLPATRERHAAYYSELVERLDPAAPTALLPFSGDSETLGSRIFDILDDAHDNVRVALQWWLDAGRPAEALTLVRALEHPGP
jgi:predicted ATPase